MGQNDELLRFYVQNVEAQGPCDIKMFSHHLIPELWSRSGDCYHIFHIWSDADPVMPP